MRRKLYLQWVDLKEKRLQHNSFQNKINLLCCHLLDKKAILQYDHTDNIIDMFHTEVPPAFQGKGLAKLLAKVFSSYSNKIVPRQTIGPQLMVNLFCPTVCIVQQRAVYSL